MLAQKNRDISNEGDICNYASNDILPFKIFLPLSVQCCIIGRIIIAFCQEFRIETEKNQLSLVYRPRYYTHPLPNFCTTLCTIGMSLPRTLYTTTSPTFVGSKKLRFQRKSKSPRWNAGSIEPESTTTIGEGEPAITESPFHIMKAVESISPKLR